MQRKHQLLILSSTPLPKEMPDQIDKRPSAPRATAEGKSFSLIQEKILGGVTSHFQIAATNLSR